MDKQKGIHLIFGILGFNIGFWVGFGLR